MNYRKTTQLDSADVLSYKPAIEPAWAIIPPLKCSPSGDDEISLFVEKECSSRVQDVKDGQIYTIRLGMHNLSASVGAFTKDTLTLCYIPTVTSVRHRIMAFFSSTESYPAAFMDDVILRADTPVRLEYVKGSAVLECNCSASELPLSDGSVLIGKDSITITTIGLNQTLPSCVTHTYDFIRFQVKIVQEQDYVINKQVCIYGTEKYSDSVTAHIGDLVEFCVVFVNDSEETAKVTVIDELPDCLEFIESRLRIFLPDGTMTEAPDTDRIISDGLVVEDCEPSTKVVVFCVAKVIDYPTDGMGRVWNWSDVYADAITLQNYAEVIIE